MDFVFTECRTQGDGYIPNLLQPETGQILAKKLADLFPQRHVSGLQLIFPPSNFSPATPVKRRGKSMSRRTGQSGHIEKSGKWWVIRWWMDVPGQEKRVLKRAKLCPISGPGALSASERKRRSREIIAKSGADTVEYFNKVVKGQHADVLTFEQQSKRWIQHLQKRKRKPVSSTTIEDWERTLKNWPYRRLSRLLCQQRHPEDACRQDVEGRLVSQDDRELHPGSKDGCRFGDGR